MDKLNIVIAGCGWLGQQIGKELKSDEHNVYGTYRSSSTKEQISAFGITPISIEDLSTIADDTGLLIIAIPPGKPENVEDYGVELQKIVSKFPVKTKVIFTSSTGIYPIKNEVFNEGYEFENSERSTPLYFAENKLRSLLQNRLTILRLGGLIGPGRHPVKFLSGRILQTDGNAPVNLIDSRDVVNLVDFIIKKDLFGELLNVSFQFS